MARSSAVDTTLYHSFLILSEIPGKQIMSHFSLSCQVMPAVEVEPRKRNGVVTSVITKDCVLVHWPPKSM